MTTYIAKKERVFRGVDIHEELPRKHSEGRMKNYQSCTDNRAWCINDEARRQYILELIKGTTGKGVSLGKYIPIEILIDLLLANKTADIERLQKQVDELQRLLDMYNKLDLTPEQRRHLGQMKDQFSRAADELSTFVDSSSEGTTHFSDVDDFSTGADDTVVLYSPSGSVICPRKVCNPTSVRCPGMRPDGRRADGTRADGTRADGTRGDGTRGYGTRSDGTRSDGTRGDGTRGAGVSGLSDKCGKPTCAAGGGGVVKRKDRPGYTPDTVELEVEIDAGSVEIESITIEAETCEDRHRDGTPNYDKLDIPALRKLLRDRDNEIIYLKGVSERAIAKLETLNKIIDENEELKRRLTQSELQLQCVINEKSRLAKSVCSDKVPELRDLETEMAMVRETDGDMSPEEETEMIKNELDVLKRYCDNLSNIQQENEQLKQENKYLKEQLGSKVRSPGIGKGVDVEILEKKLNSSAEHIQFLEDQLCCAKDDVMNSEEVSILKQRSTMLDDVLDERADMVKRLDRLSGIEDKQRKLKARADQADHLQQERDELLAEIAELQKYRRKADAQHQDIQALKGEKDCANRCLECIKSERDSLRLKVMEMSEVIAERDMLRLKMCQMDNMQDEMERLRFKAKEADVLRLERDRLQIRVEELSALEVEMMTLVEQVKTISIERDIYKRQVCDSECIIADQEDEIKNLVCHVDRLSKSVDSQQVTINNTLNGMRAELQSSQEKMDALLAVEEQLRKQLLEKQNMIDKLQKQICCDQAASSLDLVGKMTSQLKAAQGENERLQYLMDQLQNVCEKDHVGTMLSESKKAIGCVIKEVKSIIGKRDCSQDGYLMEENQQLRRYSTEVQGVARKRIDELTVKLEQAIRDNTALRTENQLLKSKTPGVATDLQISSALKASKLEVATLKTQVETLTEEMEQIPMQTMELLSSVSQQFREESAQLRAENNMLKDEIVRLEREIELCHENDEELIKMQVLNKDLEERISMTCKSKSVSCGQQSKKSSPGKSAAGTEGNSTIGEATIGDESTIGEGTVGEDGTIGGGTVGEDGTIGGGTVGEDGTIGGGTIGEDGTIGGGTIGEDGTIGGGTVEEDGTIGGGTIEEDGTIGGGTVEEDGTIGGGTVGEDGTIGGGTVGEDGTIGGGTIGEDGTIGGGTVGEDGTIGGGTVGEDGTIGGGTVGEDGTIGGGTVREDGTIGGGTIGEDGTIEGGTIGEDGTIGGGTIGEDGTFGGGTIGEDGTIGGGTIGEDGTIGGGTIGEDGTIGGGTVGDDGTIGGGTIGEDGIIAGGIIRGDITIGEEPCLASVGGDGTIAGGSIGGGTIEGGSIVGGTIKGGTIEGGTIGGTIEGGTIGGGSTFSGTRGGADAVDLDLCRKRTQELENIIEQLNSQLDLCRKRNRFFEDAAIQTSSKDLRLENKYLKSNLEDLKCENDCLRRCLMASNPADEKVAILELSLQDQNAKLEFELNELKDELECMRTCGAWAGEGGDCAEIEALRAKIRELEQTLDYVKKEKNELSEMLDEKARRGARQEEELDAELKRLKAKLANMQKANDELEAVVAEKSKPDGSVERIKDLESRVKQLEDERDELEKRLANMRSESNKLMDQMETNMRRNDLKETQLEAEIAKLRAKVLELEDLLNQRDKTITDIKASASEKENARVSDLEAKIRELEASKKDCEDRVANMTKEQNELKDKLESTLRRNSIADTEMKSELMNLNARIKELEALLADAQKENAKNKQEMNSLLEKLQKETENQAHMKKQKDENDALNDLIKKLEAQLKQIDLERAEKGALADVQQKNLEEQTKKAAALESELDALKNSSVKEIQSLKDEKQALNDKLSAMDKEKQGLNDKLNAMDKEQRALNDKLNAMKDEKQAMNEKLSAMNKQMQGLNDKLSATNQALNDKLKEAESLRAENDKLKKELDDLLRKMQADKQAEEQQKKDADALNDMLKKLEQQLRNCEAKAAKAGEDRMRQLQDELARLKAEKATMEADFKKNLASMTEQHNKELQGIRGRNSQSIGKLQNMHEDAMMEMERCYEKQIDDLKQQLADALAAQKACQDKLNAKKPCPCGQKKIQLAVCGKCPCGKPIDRRLTQQTRLITDIADTCQRNLLPGEADSNRKTCQNIEDERPVNLSKSLENLLNKAMKIGFENLKYEELVYLFNKICNAACAMGKPLIPPCIPPDRNCDRPTDKLTLMRRIAKLEEDLSCKQRFAREKVNTLEYSVDEMRNDLTMERRRNTDLTQRVCCQTREVANIEVERDMLKQQSGFHEIRLQELIVSVEEERAKIRKVQDDLAKEKVTAKYLRTCLESEKEHGINIKAKANETIEMMRLRLERALDSQSELKMQLNQCAVSERMMPQQMPSYARVSGSQTSPREAARLAADARKCCKFKCGEHRRSRGKN